MNTTDTETTRVLDRWGAALRRERQAQGLSQSIVAERAGLPQSTLSALETGRHRAARVDTFVAVCVALGADPGRVLRFRRQSTNHARSGARALR